MVRIRKVKGCGHAQGRHGAGRLFRRGRVWWVQYYIHGKKVRESSRSYVKAVAERLLMRRLVAADEGTLAYPQKPLAYAEMRERWATAWLLAHPRLTRRSVDQVLARLDEFFAGTFAGAITAERVDEFKLARRRAGASNATVNRALGYLRQMFKLSAKRVKSPPEIKLLPEPPARQGFLTAEQWQRLVAALPDRLRPIVTVAYRTGMRLGELKALTWKNVNVAEGIIRLEADQTKNREAREIPFRQLPELAAIVARLWQEARCASGLVFTRADGRRLVAVRKAFVRAALKAGLGKMCWRCPACHAKVEAAEQSWPPERPPRKAEAPACACGATCCWHYDGLIFHDLRRTAVRNLRRAGVAESVAMKLSGHKDRSVFERYNVKDRRDVVEAMERLAEFQRAEDAKLSPSGARPN